MDDAAIYIEGVLGVGYLVHGLVMPEGEAGELPVCMFETATGDTKAFLAECIGQWFYAEVESLELNKVRKLQVSFKPAELDESINKHEKGSSVGAIMMYRSPEHQ